MADVFISYASEDRDRVRPLAEALIKRGFSVWWDRALASGDDYARVIERELAAAKAVIVVWTNSSVASAFVRDEAGRARDDGRLTPVALDKISFPLGFGAFHAEDFTSWSGGAQAPQVDLLAEALRAKIEGRDPNAAEIEKKRRAAAMRIRLVSGLSMLAVAGAVGAGLFIVSRPAAPVQEASLSRADQLLKLLQEGKITGAEAIELAKVLETQAFADAPSAPAGQSGPVATAPTTADLVSVSFADMSESARATFADAAGQLAQDPDPKVRAALWQASAPQTRTQGLQALWDIAKAGGPSASTIWRACGALMVAHGDERAAVALERAGAQNPQDARVWRMLSFAFGRAGDSGEAQGAAIVTAALDSIAQGDRVAAAERFAQALPYVKRPAARSFLLGQLGDIAVETQDLRGAVARFREAIEIDQQGKDVGSLSLNASKLARAQVTLGHERAACVTLREAQSAGAQVTDQELAAACRQQRPGLQKLIAPPQPQ